MNAVRAAVLAALLAAAGLAGADTGAVYQRQGDDGTVELTNIPDGSPADYQPVVTPPTPAAGAPQGTAAASPPTAPKPVSISDGPMGDTLRDLYSGAHAAHQAAGH